MILDAVFWGLLAARLAYIAQWWEEYSVVPKSMIAIGDGGFTWWVGVPVAVIYIWRRARSAPTLRGPVLAGVMAGVVAWTRSEARTVGNECVSTVSSRWLRGN